jgi:peptidylprolyl isomerase
MTDPKTTNRPGPAAIALGLLLAVTCFRAAAADVVARIGGTDVTREELRSYVETLGPAERAALAKDPALLSQAVRAYLARRAVLAEVRSKKWDQDPSVKARLERARDEALTDLYLDAVSRPPAGYPDDAQVQAVYQRNPAAFQVPRQLRVAQIFISSPAGSDKQAEEKARRRAEEIGRKVRQPGADFAAIARTESDDKEGARNGGEIGWLTEAQLVPGIRAPAAGLGKDAASDPIRLDDGWHVVKVLDIRPASTRPLAEVRDAIAAQLLGDRARASRQAYLAKLLEQSPPVVNELALSNLLVPAK